MAAAIVPIVLSAVSVVAPLIPGVITFVENLFGKGTGAQKMQASVDILTKILQDMANAGKIPSAPVVDPGLATALQGAVQSVFDNQGKGGNVNVGGTNTSTGLSTLVIGKVTITFPIGG